MPYKDPEKRKENERKRGKAYRERKRAKKYGPGAPDMRGRHGNHLSGATHPRWTQGRIVSSDGYPLVRVGADHQLADPNGYVYEHMLVWVAAGNSRPSAGHVLHHRNGDKSDNRISNLVLISKSEHGAHHIAERNRDGSGRLVSGAQ